MQSTAWQLTVALVAAVAAIFLFVKSQSGRLAEYQNVTLRAYRWRTALFWLLIAAAVPITALTLEDLPYVHAASPGTPQVVTLTAHQWSWDLDREEIMAGQPVEFRVSGADVNHGVGIYDRDLTLVAQTQAMPGYVNRIRHTFQEPGTYRLMCLEYCGLGHHDMVSEIKVVQP